MVDEIDNVISTLFQPRKSYVNPICIFNLFSTSIQRRKGNFQRSLDFERTSFCPLGYLYSITTFDVQYRDGHTPANTS